MTKKLLQDMVQDESRRSIRRISIDHSRRTKNKPVAEPAEDTESEDVYQEDSSTTPPRDPFQVKRVKEPRRRRSWLVWGIAVVVAIILFVVIFSTIFAGAEVTTYPRQENVTLEGQFTAQTEPESADAVPFEVMQISRTGVEEVEATGQSQVDRKASGEITIKNNYSTESQRLINNTRFETPEGLIYRIDKSVVVPGKTDEGPGTIDVTVFADTSGEEYNIGLTSFTIPGLASDPERFNSFSAESKTPMTGGFSGIERTVSPGDLEVAKEAIQQRLMSEIAGEAQSEVPEGYILFDGSQFVDFESLSNADTDNTETVLVREEATLYGLIFRKADLAEFVAENTIGTYDGADVEALGLESLDFAIVDKALLEPSSITEFDFTLSGSTNIVWLYDSERLKADLAGKHRRDVETVFSGYPAIESADISLRPFWKRSFPGDKEDIDVEREIDG